MTTDDERPGPDFTIVASGRTVLLDSWVLVRRQGGRLVRLTFPLLRRPGVNDDAVIALALKSIPDYPSRDAY